MTILWGGLFFMGEIPLYAGVEDMALESRSVSQLELRFAGEVNLT